MSKFVKGYLQKLVFKHLAENLFWQSPNILRGRSRLYEYSLKRSHPPLGAYPEAVLKISGYFFVDDFRTKQLFYGPISKILNFRPCFENYLKPDFTHPFWFIHPSIYVTNKSRLNFVLSNIRLHLRILACIKGLGLGSSFPL